MNKNALTLGIARGFVFADAASGINLGMDIINNVISGVRLPRESLTSINKIIRGEGTDGLGLQPILDIYGDKEIDASGEPVLTFGQRITNGHERDLLDAIFGKLPRTSPHTDDHRAADHVEANGHDFEDAVERDVDIEDLERECDRLVFGDGTFTERVERPKAESFENAENGLLKSTLITQSIIALQTLQALFDDTDFDDLVEDMIENLSEKRDSLLVE